MDSSGEPGFGLRRRAVAAGGILLVLTLLALALRLYRLDAQSLWYDEGFSVYLARMDLAEITSRTAADIQPPLYYYLLHFWIDLLGDGEQALRGLSLLFGVLTVPLIYATAYLLYPTREPGRGLTGGHLAGLLAAFLLAVSPLHIWYGQEARMYTMLTFLCLLSSILLLLASRTRRIWVAVVLWTAYSLASIAAAYTHYFAFFVLAFQALYILFLWVGQGLKPAGLIIQAFASGVAVLLAYLPWIPHLVTRYGADVSYWPGNLKILEVLVDMAVFYVGGESITEQTGLALASGFGIILVLALFALATAARNRQGAGAAPGLPSAGDGLATGTGRLPALFLLLYLLVPPALIILLSYGAPKFNARYVMISHPALVLLFACGLAALFRREGNAAGAVLRRGLAGVSLIFLVGVSAYADTQIYRAPEVARADFRGAADHIRQQIGPDETVILTSGHSYPIFDYYAPDLERHLLPDSPTLDTTRTLDYAIADDLNRWLAGRGGVWVVLWQDNVVDPVGYLPAMLESVGEEVPVEASFTRVELKHYRLPEGTQFSGGPSIDHPASYDFGDRLRLLGYSQSGPWQVTFFWEALQSLDEDYRLSLVLRDTLGQGWGQWDGRPADYYYPTTRWRAGQIVFGRYDLVPMAGTPPGDYGLDVGVYTEEDPIGLDVLDSAGAAQGKRLVLGAVRLSVPAVTAGELPIPHPIEADAGGGLVLLGWDLGRYQAQPGDRMLLSLVWTAQSQPGGDYDVGLILSDATGQVLSAGRYPPTNMWHPTSMWQAGQAWRGQTTFRLPVEAQPGEANLSIRLLTPEGQAAGPALDLSTIEVLATTRIFDPPQPRVGRSANFDDLILLLGADLSTKPVPPGGSVVMTLHWQARADMDVPYTVFVHLLGPEGDVVAGHDGQPSSGSRPTTGWVPGEYVADSHKILIPADQAPGDYFIEVGLYDAGVLTFPRLPILSDEGQPVTDRIIFGPVPIRK